jgi:hypothetical protein
VSSLKAALEYALQFVVKQRWQEAQSFDYQTFIGFAVIMERTAEQLFFEQLETSEGVFWVGAGIGVDAPTRLPLLAAICHTNGQLEQAIFSGAEAPISLLRPCWLAQASLRPCAEATKALWRRKGSLRLELVLQCLKEALGTDYVGALQFLKDPTPNQYHHFWLRSLNPVRSS